jgi:LuxR family maltose regulon positive regulatory protein
MGSVLALERPPRTRPAGLVPRPRLVRRLREAADVPVALLVAPAGYGKTTVLGEWAEHDPRPFAWIRLDGEHDDPPRLIASVADALGSAAGTITGLAKRLASAPEPFVLVLDDVDALRSPGASEVLDAIADCMPVGSQVALAGRREPGLAVGRLRAHRRVVELRTDDLAMGRPEAAVLLERAGVRLGGDDLAWLVRRTEGWPAGLYLAALSLRAQPDVRAAARRFAGDDRIVADYLRDELLAPLAPDRLDFLLRSAVLDTLTAPACDALLGTTGSGAALAELARSNTMLVCLDRSGESYRHHRLFAQMLRAELRRREPDTERQLHRRASGWYAGSGDAHAAINHAIAAGDGDVARGLLWDRAPGAIAQGRNDAVRGWLDEFAAEEIAASPRLSVVAAASHLAAGDRGQAERWTAEAARGLDGSDADGPIAAPLTILRAACGRDGISRMGADAAGAARSEPEHSPWRSLARLLEGAAHHLAGGRADARVPLEEVGRRGSAAPNVQSLCLAQHALLVIEDEDWDEAALLMARARSHVKTFGLERYPTMSLVFAVSGLVRAHRGVVDEARRDVLWSVRLLDQLADFAPWYEAETRIALARATLGLGDVAAARSLLTEAARTLRHVPESTTLRAWLEQARSQLEAATRSAGGACALTTAELRVLRMLPTHLSLATIASRLCVSPNTVKTQVRSLYRKLGASSREEAVAQAFAAGLLDDLQAA